MSRREFFESVAGRWDQNEKIDYEKLKRIIKMADIRKGEKVLDIGSGTGVLLPLLRQVTGKGNRVFALDISFNMLKRSAEKFRNLFSYIQSDASALPLVGEIFDKVICFAVFPHFPFKKKVLSEIERVLKNRGEIFIAHSASRNRINTFHKKVGDVVKNDAIPHEKKMIELFGSAGFNDICIKDAEDFYLASGIKP